MPYEFREFPKWKYHASESALIVESPEHEEALSEGWHDHPYAVEAAAAPAPAPAPAARKPKK